MVGENRFTLFGEDVTPAPCNQPPYWPAGETQTDFCTSTATLPGGQMTDTGSTAVMSAAP
jgi:hypothetical protein